MAYTTVARSRSWGVRWLAPLTSGISFVLIYIAASSEPGTAIEDRVLTGAVPPLQLPVILGLVNVPLLIVVGGSLILLPIAQQNWDRALAAALTLGVSNVTTQMLKYLLLPELGSLEGANSFPSGHMTAYVSVFATLLIVAPIRYAGIVGFISIATSSLVAVELLRYGYHRLSDVVGSIVLVVTIMSISVMISDRFRRKDDTGRPRLGLIHSRIPSLAACALITQIVAIDTLRRQPLTIDHALLGCAELIATFAVCGAFMVMASITHRARSNSVNSPDGPTCTG